MPSSRPGGRRRGAVHTLARVTLYVLAVELVVFTASTLPGVREEPGFSVLVDGWLQGSAYVTAAFLAALRTLVSRADRALWIGVSAALAARAFGFVVYLAMVRTAQPLPVPSLADAGWLAMYVLLMVALMGLARSSFTRLSTALVLDGLIGVFAVGGIAVALVWGMLQRAMQPSTPALTLATNLAYPVLDAALLLTITGVLAAFAWKPPPAVWALGVGTVGFAVTDVVYLYQSALGTYRPGTPVAALSMLATATIAAAAWLPGRRAFSRPNELPGVVLPGLFAIACLALLVYAGVRAVPPLSVVLTGIGACVAIARTVLSFRALRSLAQQRRDARTDDVTGLANRRALIEALTLALQGRPHTRGLALLVVDLDDFKAVNDALGHDLGDELLTVLAPRMQQVLRSDDVLARTGGDEFAVLLEEADAQRAIEVAKRLRAGLRRPFDLAGRPVELSGSVGISLFPGDGTEVVRLMQRAELAMYDAKATRAGYSVFRAQQQRDSRTRLESNARLRRAVAEELVVHYQPQVSLVTGRVVAVEALVRWDHPDDGLVLPSAFLPHVESAGLMDRLTAVVLEQAIRQGAAWRDAGTPVRIAVNLSVTNLLDADLPGLVSQLLRRHGVPGDALEVELTEDLALADPDRARAAIDALLAVGVRLQVDDYGTGYASLGYLRDLSEISGLKLDRSFVTRLDVDPRSQAIVESTVGLARRLGLSLVAEGVETVAVRDRLARLGCQLAQGYLFSAPVPAADLSLGVIEVARAVPR
jgi:diguanylate cyclase